jgi:hypothetical protein
MKDDKLDSPKYIQNKRTKFDPNFGPQNPINIAAARERGLTYDPLREAYIDSDGCLIRDRYGQRF